MKRLRRWGILELLLVALAATPALADGDSAFRPMEGIGTSEDGSLEGLLWTPPALDGRPRRIRSISVRPHDIFDIEGPARSFAEVIYHIADGLHTISDEDVIRRELLFREGDAYDLEVARESARNLRALGIVSAIEMYAIPVGADEVDLVVETHDRFSLRISAGLSLVGGELRGTAFLGERNLAGRAISLIASTIQLSDRAIYAIDYLDPRLVGTRLELGVELSYAIARRQRPRDDYRAAVSLEQPLYALDTPWSYGLAAAHQRDDLPYYLDGEEVADLPEDRTEASVFAVRALGPTGRRVRLGAACTFERHVFEDPFGEDTTIVGRPGDFVATTLAFRPGLDLFARFLRRTRIDAINFVEDVPIGLFFTLSAGASYWAGDIEGWRFPLGGSVVLAWDPFQGSHLIAIGARGSVRVRAGEARAHNVSLFYHHYFFGLPEQTIALNVAFDAVEDAEGARPQLTLGEDDGLRGFDARLFQGRRMIRMNLEDRIFTPIEVASVHLGVVVFADAGFAWEAYDDLEWDDLQVSTGLGFRVGSAELFGHGVGRLDVAFPLTGDDRFEVSVSFTTGQVFSIFEIPSKLADRF